MEKQDTKLDMLELQIEAIRAQEFARGYTAALQFIANKAQGEQNDKSKLDTNKISAGPSK